MVENLGGPATPGVGFAFGVDRTLIACDDAGVFPAPVTSVDVFVVDTTGGREALLLTTELRRAGISADRPFDNRSMKAQTKLANRSGAQLALIVGTDELDAKQIVVRPMRTDDLHASVSRADGGRCQLRQPVGAR